MTEPAQGIHFHSSRKLGLRPNDPAKPRLMLGRQLVRTVPEHPVASSSFEGVTLGMDFNDRFGTCVPTGFDNFRRMATLLLTGEEIAASGASIIAWYRTQNPRFDPNVPGGVQDEGMVIQDFLAWLVKQGLILGFAGIDVGDDEMLKAADYLAMGPINGLDLAEAQVRGQYDIGTWDYDPHSPQAGGHCVPTGAFSDTAAAEEDCATWAKRIHMTQTFLDAQRSEAWAVLLPEHVTHPGFREHFDLAGFAAAYTEITGRPFPVAIDTPPAPPAPDPGEATFRLTAPVAAAVARWAARHQVPVADAPNELLRRELHVR